MMGNDSVEYPAAGALVLRAAQRRACAAASATKFVPTAPYAVLNGTTYDGIHHYYGRADTIVHIGTALGEGMLELLAGQCDMAHRSNVWINEFHYDNTGTDTNEFIEIAHTISLTGCQVQLYRAGWILYRNISLTGTVPSATVDSVQFTVVEFTTPEGIDNGSPSGLVLTDTRNNVVEFLSYEGILMNVSSDMVSTDVNVREDEATPLGHSLQKCPNFNVWTGPLPNTKGQPNLNCTLPTACGIFGLRLFCFRSAACGWFERFFRLNGCSFPFHKN
jgi:hypothetical protein